MPIGYELQRNLRALRAIGVGACLSFAFLGLFLGTTAAVKTLWPGVGSGAAEAASWLSMLWCIPALGLVGWAWSRSGLPARWGCIGFVLGYVVIAIVAVVLSLTLGI
jgi:hypothetical protein